MSKVIIKLDLNCISLSEKKLNLDGGLIWILWPHLFFACLSSAEVISGMTASKSQILHEFLVFEDLKDEKHSNEIYFLKHTLYAFLRAICFGKFQ